MHIDWCVSDAWLGRFLPYKGRKGKEEYLKGNSTLKNISPKINIYDK